VDRKDFRKWKMGRPIGQRYKLSCVQRQVFFILEHAAKIPGIIKPEVVPMAAVSAAATMDAINGVKKGSSCLLPKTHAFAQTSGAVGVKHERDLSG